MQGKEERERRKEETVTTSFEVGVDRESAGWRAACLATRCQPRLIDGFFISDVDTSASANPFVKDVYAGQRITQHERGQPWARRELCRVIMAEHHQRCTRTDR